MGELVKLEQLHWGEKLSTLLNNMRSSQTLCDTAIVCRDESTLRCHKCVVAASSTAMSKVLIDLEGKKELTPGKEILVRTNIEKDIWEAVLQFMYTGIAIIKPERMTYLRRVAEKFCISELHDLCTEFERQESSKASENTTEDIMEETGPRPTPESITQVAQNAVGNNPNEGSAQGVAQRPTSMGMPIPQQYPAPQLTLSTPIFQGADDGQIQNMIDIPGPALPTAVSNSDNPVSIGTDNIIPSGECLESTINGAGLAVAASDIAGAEIAVSAADNLSLVFPGLDPSSTSDGMFTPLPQTTNYSTTNYSTVAGNVVYSCPDAPLVNSSFDSLTSQAITEMLSSSTVTSVTELLNPPALVEKAADLQVGFGKPVDMTSCMVVPDQEMIGEPGVMAPIGYFQNAQARQEAQSSTEPSVPPESVKLPATIVTQTATSAAEKNLLNSGLPDVVPSDQLTPFVTQKLEKNSGFLKSFVDSLKDDNNYINSEPSGEKTPSEGSSSSTKNIKELTQKKIHADQGNMWKDKKQCRHCGQKFTSVRKLLQHGRADHPGEKMRVFYCGECDQDFFNSQQLQMHLSYHNSVDSLENFICEHCGNTFGEVRRLEAHIDNVHREKNLTCKLCGALFTRTVQLEDHLEKYCTGKYTIIPNNQTGTATAESLSSETQDSDSQSLPDYTSCPLQTLMTYVCDTCKQVFSTVEQLAAHAHVHIASGRLTPFSDVSSSLFSQVSDALQINESETTCSIHDNIDDLEMVPNCELLSPTKLIGGSISPETDMPNLFHLKPTGPFMIKGRDKKKSKRKCYQCNLCKEQFSTVLGKAGHLQRHSCPHRCNICGRRFYKQYLLKKHKFWYHSEFLHLPLNFKCKYCENSFSSESMLQFHTNTKHFPLIASQIETLSKGSLGQKKSKFTALKETSSSLQAVDESGAAQSDAGWSQGEAGGSQGGAGGSQGEAGGSQSEAWGSQSDAQGSQTNSDQTLDSITSLACIAKRNLHDELVDSKVSGDTVYQNVPRPAGYMVVADNMADTHLKSFEIDHKIVGPGNNLPGIGNADNIELPMDTTESLIPGIHDTTDTSPGVELIVESTGMDVSVTTDYNAVVSSDDPFIPPPAAYMNNR